MRRIPVLLSSALLFTAAVATPQAPASIKVQVSVPTSMRTSPFNVARWLDVPPNFVISVLARVGGARFMAVAPNADVLVSQPSAGRIMLVRPNVGGDPTLYTFVSGLHLPHDIVFATLSGVSWVYVAEAGQINRYRYNVGDIAAHDRQIIVPNLPDASSPELGGSYGHQLKNIAISPAGKLYVSIASATNASTSDAIASPVRCAIYEYSADGKDGRLFARGLRNAEGLAILPGTNTLWVTVNHRDNIRYPFRNDFDGNGTIDFGRVMTSYVDNHPPDLFTAVLSGANYGWPYANPNPDSASGLTNMPLDPDYDNNRDWTQFPQSAFTRSSKGIQAHSAPLGVSFLHGTTVPSAYRSSAVVALHGSWNRTTPTGYKVVLFPFSAAGAPGAQIDLVRGWIDAAGAVWGRPVDVVPDRSGNILISDDRSGAIYRLSPTANPAGPQIASFSLINADSGTPIAGFNPMVANATIRLSTLGARGLAFSAQTNPAAVGSVRIVLAGPNTYQVTDASAPYVIPADSNGDIRPLYPPLAPGSYNLTATAYSGAAQSGTAGPPLSIAFTVVP